LLPASKELILTVADVLFFVIAGQEFLQVEPSSQEGPKEEEGCEGQEAKDCEAQGQGEHRSHPPFRPFPFPEYNFAGYLASSCASDCKDTGKKSKKFR